MKRIIPSFITFLCISLVSAPNTNAQKLNLKRIFGAETSALPDIKFNADDPIGNLALSTAGLPWEDADVTPIEMPKGVSVTLPPPLPDLDKLSTIQYNSAVSLAFESLRIIYGEMSEKEAKRFSAMWAPLYDAPSQKLIDYLNKLNPLLTQFLVARETYFRTAADVEILYFDAAEAVKQDDSEAFKGIMFESNLLTGSMKSLENAMTEIANRIKKLGNPPNPFEAKAAARRRYKSAFTEKKDSVIYIGECWMGTRESNMSVPGLPPLTEVMFRYLFKAKVNGKDRYYVIELSENGIPDKYERDDEAASLKYMDVKQYECYNSDGRRPDFTSDGKFQSYLPKPPAMAITALTMNYLMLREASEDVDKEYYYNVCHYGNRILRAGFFFKTAVDWSISNKWNEYTFYGNGMVPKDCLKDFAEAVREEMRKDLADRQKSKKERREAAAQARSEAASLPMDPESIRQKAYKDSVEFERKSKQESIETRQELIREIEKQIDRENEYRSRARERYYSAATDAERRSAQAEMDDIDRRIMYMRSNIQNERDNIQTLKTGEYVHTRTDFDQYAHNHLIQSMKEDAARRDATRRYANGIEKQIELLPPEERDAARERAEKLFYDNGALVSGNVEEARKLAKLFNNQILAKELKVQAEAEEAIAYADIKEAGANAVIMACGSVTVGLAAEAFTAAYGSGAAIVTYGPKVIGAVYSGATGYIAGGAEKGICSAVGSIHPATQAMVSFYEGFTDETNAGKTTGEKMWEGAKKMGFDYIVGKGMEIGSNAFAKTAGMLLPKGTAKFNMTEKLSIFRTQKQKLEAQDAIATFAKASGEYKRLLQSGTATKAQIDAARDTRDKLSAILNADYHAKWHMKYKASDELKGSFNEGVQANYDRMIPKMKAELEAKGFQMDDIDFKQFRNASSAGSSSMDLDFGAVSKTTGKEPAFFRDGKAVSAEEFMKEAQKTMNSVYRAQTGMSAKASEMNLTTSAHPEAFNTPELLEKEVDWYHLTVKDVASVGKVINVKMDAIEKNSSMTLTTKLQAKAREATKEVQNMLIPKLKQDLAHAKNAKQASEIAENLTYWQDMQKKLAEMGKGTNDPLKIMEINNQIKEATGGKDATQVVNDLAREFSSRL